jgi:hypothetical protein
MALGFCINNSNNSLPATNWTQSAEVSSFDLKFAGEKNSAPENSANGSANGNPRATGNQSGNKVLKN